MRQHRIVLGLAAGCALVLAAAPPPASAACAQSYAVDTGATPGSDGGPYVISNADWCGQGGAGTGFGCYDSDGGPPISDDFIGVFWSLGAGSAEVGLGDDNGAWHVSNWSKQVSLPAGGQMYHYPAWLTLPAGPNYFPGVPFAWNSSPLIDGCVANQGATTGIDGTECTCVMLNDQWGGEGYFTLLAARADESGNFHLSTGGDIRLASIPRPEITDTRRRSNYDVEVDVRVPLPAAGISQQGGCDCGIGYKVFAYLFPAGEPRPVDRSVGWFEPPPAGGGTQPITEFGQETTVVVDCDETETSYFVLSARIYAAGGFPTRYGSPDSVWVQCSPLCSSQDLDGDGVTECAGDCDNGNADVYPGAPEVCDGVHNDCATPHWPSLTETNEFDDDGDLFSECQGDCDDTSTARFPGNLEICDGLDNDCAGGVPANDVDADSDGSFACAGDCDDTRAVVYPGAPQQCDGLNNDCLDANWPGVPAAETDDDGDAYAECQGDCNDGSSTIHPSAAETCNAIDDNCNTLVDEDDLGQDTDGDGVHNLCDNCLVDRNPTQSDMDTDYEGDLCDVDDGVIYMLFDEPAHVEWQEETGFGSWNSYRGDLAVLRSAGVYTQDPAVVPLAARSCNLSTASAPDADPPPGGAVFLLTTGNLDGTGVESSLGVDGFGVERPNTRPCP